MKLVKSLLLGSVAGVAAVASAQAADLPFRKAAPVEYVRVCDWTGAGYFYIPGTDTCLKIEGMIRAEYVAQSQSAMYFPQAPGPTPAPIAVPTAAGTAAFFPGTRVRGNTRDLSGFYVRARLAADARTQTAYGTLRTYVRFDLYDFTGAYAPGATGGNGAGGFKFNNQNREVTTIDKGYIQFAGFTAGRAQSMFDFYADNYNYEAIANSDQSTEMFAYTATFGGGFSATISVEDRNVRDSGIGNTFVNSPTDPATKPFIGLSTADYQGETIPDVVGVLRVDQAWGSAQLSAAYHDLNTTSTAFTGFGIGDTGHAVSNTTEAGWAVQGGVDIKLPMLAAGDELWLEGAYQNGAYLYQDSDVGFNNGFYGPILGGFQHLDKDAIAVQTTTGHYDLHLAEGFSVLAALHHYFTPQFHDVLFGSYEEIGYGTAVNNISWLRGGLGNASEYRVGNQFIWTPVHNLDIGLEFMYAHIDQHIAGTGLGTVSSALATAAFAATGVKQNPDAFIGRLHVERDF